MSRCTQIHKLVYNWAALNHRLSSIDKNNPTQCPSCPQLKESITHFLTCPSWKSSTETTNICQQLNKLPFPQSTKLFLITRLQSYFESKVLQDIMVPPTILLKTLHNIRQWDAVDRQLTLIGPHALIFGFIPKTLYTFTQYSTTNHPVSQQQTISNFITSLHNIILTKWALRNKQQHIQQSNNSNIAIREQLTQFLHNPPPLLSQDQHLLHVYTPHLVPKIDNDTINQLLDDIQTATVRYKSSPQNSKQQLITSYFSQKT